LKNKQLIDEANLTVHLGHGEICLHPEFEEIVNEISNYKVVIYTNAGIYSEKIAELMQRNKCSLSVSIDSGTPETFRKIKGVNVYEKVKNNLVRYGKLTDKNVLKYIFLSGINDNTTDIEGFIDLCVQTNSKSCAISCDYSRSDMNLPTKTLHMIKHMLNYASEKQVTTSFIDMFFSDDDLEKIRQQENAVI
jgi:MoaA/NifB/PqqE/SkfB family radical SAM enzyme